MIDGVTRIALALIPTEALFQKVIEASEAITRRFENQNVIDQERFPPHVTLHICTVPSARLEELWVEITALRPQAALLPVIEAEAVTTGSSGYIHLAVRRSARLQRLHEHAIERCARVRRGMREEVRPHRRSQERSKPDHNLITYGNAYVLDSFHPHFSIAKLQERDVSAGRRLAEDYLRPPFTSTAQALQLADVGMSNEHWVVRFQRTAARAC